MLSSLRKWLAARPRLQIRYWSAKLFWRKLVTAATPDALYVRYKHFRHFGRLPNLANPSTFNEKLAWMKLRYRNPDCITCADKFAVRDYVRTRLGEGVLNELYGDYSHYDQIDFSRLPQGFVLKVNHGSGQNLIVMDKSTINHDETRLLFNYYSRENHYLEGREWAYKGIKPRIICEKLLLEGGVPPKDFKIFCFNGEPHMIQVDVERFSGHRRNLYTLDWQRIPIRYGYDTFDYAIDRPADLDTMLDYSRKLSRGFPFVRVDFYVVERRVIFGEMTFYPDSATCHFDPPSFDLELGGMLKLDRAG